SRGRATGQRARRRTSDPTYRRSPTQVDNASHGALPPTRGFDAVGLNPPRPAIHGLSANTSHAIARSVRWDEEIRPDQGRRRLGQQNLTAPRRPHSQFAATWAPEMKIWDRPAHEIVTKER